MYIKYIYIVLKYFDKYNLRIKLMPINIIKKGLYSKATLQKLIEYT